MALDFIAFVTTITASVVTNVVSSELQSPPEVSVLAEIPLRGSRLRECDCSLRVGERRPHDQSRTFRTVLHRNCCRPSRMAGYSLQTCSTPQSSRIQPFPRRDPHCAASPCSASR